MVAKSTSGSESKYAGRSAATGRFVLKPASKAPERSFGGGWSDSSAGALGRSSGNGKKSGKKG